jgi:hypothetical protein
MFQYAGTHPMSYDVRIFICLKQQFQGKRSYLATHVIGVKIMLINLLETDSGLA